MVGHKDGRTGGESCGVLFPPPSCLWQKCLGLGYIRCRLCIVHRGFSSIFRDAELLKNDGWAWTTGWIVMLMNLSSTFMMLELNNQGRLEGGDWSFMNIVCEVKHTDRFVAGLPTYTSVWLMKLVGMMAAWLLCHPLMHLALSSPSVVASSDAGLWYIVSSYKCLRTS